MTSHPTVSLKAPCLNSDRRSATLIKVFVVFFRSYKQILRRCLQITQYVFLSYPSQSFTLYVAYIYAKMAVFWVVAPCNLVNVYLAARRYNPEDSHLRTQTSNLKSYLQSMRCKNPRIKNLKRNGSVARYMCTQFLNLSVFPSIFLAR
jgi:hypothetical protein